MSEILYPNTLWLGVPDFSKDNLKNFDPAYTGYVHIFVIRVPPVLEKYDAKFGTSHGKNFKAIFERVTTSFTGLPDLTVNFQDQTHGFADRRMPHATHTEYNFDTGTFRCLEFKEMPVHSCMKIWAEMAGGDPISKIKDYKGMAAEMPGGYSLENHTAAFLILNTDPSLTKIQGNAHYITAAAPTTVSMEMFNWNAGEIGIVEGIDVPIRGVLRWGAEVNARGMELLEARKKVINYYTGSDPKGNYYMHKGGNLNGDTIAAQKHII